MDKAVEYFNGDQLAASVWRSKYQLKDENDNPLEETPTEMHHRLAKEIALIEEKYINKERGSHLFKDTSSYYKLRKQLTEKDIFDFLDRFSFMIPGGSTMQLLGNPYQIGSLSNCFVIGQPADSYSGIFKLREEQAQLMKRRGGVGKDLSSLRPKGARVNNAAKTSTGAASFMHVDSEITREVAQDGRRGALMLTLDIRHPDSLEFITIKQNLKNVTGANISIMLRDDFMEAVEKDQDYYLRWPVDSEIFSSYNVEYNKLYETTDGNGRKGFAKKIRAKEYWETLCKCAWNTAEPGIMFIDQHWNYSPDGTYPEHRGITTNPCGEIFMPAYDACRLIAANVFSLVVNPFMEDAHIDYDNAYVIFYEMLRIADDIIDLEIRAVNRIILACEPNSVEWKLWDKVLSTMVRGRRTGCGLTGLGDMLAAVRVPYGSEKAREIVNKLMQIKMQAELDCGIDMAIVRGQFPSFSADNVLSPLNQGMNPFWDTMFMLFPDRIQRVVKWGLRNVSWSTVAPTGTISMMTQTTSGIEPVTSLYYTRRVKMLGRDGTPDYIDPNDGEWYKEFRVYHPKIYEWYNKLGYDMGFEDHSKEKQDMILEESPWYNSTAADLSTEARVAMQAIVQTFTTHSISSTVNLPRTATVEDVSNIYMLAWHKNLKGITVYREGSRAGIVVTKSDEEFMVHHAPKRGKVLPANFHQTVVKGVRYGVIVGLKNNKPYELFAFIDTDKRDKFLKGHTYKIASGKYSFMSVDKKFRYDDLSCCNDIEEKAATLYGSMLLRHGAPITHVIKTMKKVNENIVSFTVAVTRILAKYIPNGSISAEQCPNCGTTLTFENGCSICKNCGSTAC